MLSFDTRRVSNQIILEGYVFLPISYHSLCETPNTNTLGIVGATFDWTAFGCLNMETIEDDISLISAASKFDEDPLLKEKADEDSLEGWRTNSCNGFLSRCNKKASSILFLISVTINIALCVSLLVSRGQVTHERSTYGLHFQREISSKLY